MTSLLNRLKRRIFVPMNKVTDIDLQWYEAVRQDNYPAFEKLFQKYYDPLCRYAQGLLADGSLAEDVVQDMFIHFWENRIKLQVKDSLRAYFYTCIRHRALKNLQKQVAHLGKPRSQRRRTNEVALGERREEARQLFRLLAQACNGCCRPHR